MIEDLSRARRREVLSAGVELLKSGGVPSPDGPPPRPTRAQIREARRAIGNRGTKTAKNNPHRHENRLRAGGVRVQRAVLVDDALHAAKDRVEHPIRSRLWTPGRP